MNRLTDALLATAFLFFAGGAYASVYRLTSVEPSYLADRAQSQAASTAPAQTGQSSTVATAASVTVQSRTTTTQSPARQVTTPTQPSATQTTPTQNQTTTTTQTQPTQTQPGATSLAPMLFLSDGNGHTMTLGDNASGVISFSGTLGQFNLSITTSAPSGQAMLPTLTLSSLSYFGYRQGTLTISLSEASLTTPGGTITSKINGQTTMGSLSYSTFLDTSNKLFGKGTVLNTQGTFSGGSFAGTASAALSSHSPFSLTETIILQQSSRGRTTFGAVVVDPPAPVALVPDTGSTLAFLGLTLLGLEAIRRGLRSA